MIAVLEIVHDLLRCGKSGIDISLCGLRSHFLGRENIAVAEFGNGFVVCFEFEVGHVAQVGAFFKGANQSFLVDDVLPRGVHENAVLAHFHHEVVADAAARLRRGGHVEAHDMVVDK